MGTDGLKYCCSCISKHIREYYNIESLWGDAKITTIKTNTKEI
jgi:ribosomal silencing factor RsfS